MRLAGLLCGCLSLVCMGCQPSQQVRMQAVLAQSWVAVLLICTRLVPWLQFNQVSQQLCAQERCVQAAAWGWQHLSSRRLATGAAALTATRSSAASRCSAGPAAELLSQACGVMHMHLPLSWSAPVYWLHGLMPLQTAAHIPLMCYIRAKIQDSDACGGAGICLQGISERLWSRCGRCRLSAWSHRAALRCVPASAFQLWRRLQVRTLLATHAIAVAVAC